MTYYNAPRITDIATLEQSVNRANDNLAMITRQIELGHNHPQYIAEREMALRTVRACEVNLQIARNNARFNA